jgi:hypothetical protein
VTYFVGTVVITVSSLTQLMIGFRTFISNNCYCAPGTCVPYINFYFYKFFSRETLDVNGVETLPVW